MNQLKIQLQQDYKSFKNGFSFIFKGPLIILSGVNGSGKSQLLDIVRQQVGNNIHSHIGANIDIDGVYVPKKHILYRSFKENINLSEISQSWNQGTGQQKGQAFNAYNSHRLDSSRVELLEFSQSADIAKNFLVGKYGEAAFNSGQITQQQLYAALPSDFIRKNDDVFTNLIGEVFFSYAIQVQNKIVEEAGRGNIFEPNNNDAPRTKLNDLLKEFNLEYRVKDIYKIEGLQLNEEPKLYHLNTDGTLDSENSRSLSDLSDGEKAIISLAFVSLTHVTSTNKKLILLDEFDATFNPSLTEVFYAIIDRYFITKGIGVVIATHSSTTISLAPTYANFYEVFKPSKYEKRIIAVERDKYQEMEKVNKVFYDKIFQQEQRIQELLIEVNKVEALHQLIHTGVQPIIITEGKTDIKHIRKAKISLGINDLDIELYELPTSLGESNLKKFLEAQSILNQPRKVIGIFDRDNLSIIQNIENAGQRFKSYGNNVFAFCLPIPDSRREYANISIEMYYSDEEIKKENEGKSLYFNNEVDYLYNKSTGQHEIRKLEHLRAEGELSKKIFDEERMCEIAPWMHSKTTFATLVEEDVNFATGFNFSNFNLIFERIREIINSN